MSVALSVMKTALLTRTTAQLSHRLLLCSEPVRRCLTGISSSSSLKNYSSFGEFYSSIYASMAFKKGMAACIHTLPINHGSSPYNPLNVSYHIAVQLHTTMHTPPPEPPFYSSRPVDVEVCDREVIGMNIVVIRAYSEEDRTNNDPEIVEKNLIAVRPTRMDSLSPYCSQLTGISADMAENAEPLEHVLMELNNIWMDKYKSFALVSANEGMFHSLLRNEARRKGLSIPACFLTSLVPHVNVHNPAVWEALFSDGIGDSSALFDSQLSDRPVCTSIEDLRNAAADLKPLIFGAPTLDNDSMHFSDPKQLARLMAAAVERTRPVPVEFVPGVVRNTALALARCLSMQAGDGNARQHFVLDLYDPEYVQSVFREQGGTQVVLHNMPLATLQNMGSVRKWVISKLPDFGVRSALESILRAVELPVEHKPFGPILLIFNDPDMAAAAVDMLDVDLSLFGESIIVQPILPRPKDVHDLKAVRNDDRTLRFKKFEQRLPKPDATVWHCETPLCHLVNPVTALRCGLCRSYMPSKRRDGLLMAPDPERDDEYVRLLALDGWWPCTICQHVNRANQLTCVWCNKDSSVMKRKQNELSKLEITNPARRWCCSSCGNEDNIIGRGNEKTECRRCGTSRPKNKFFNI